jgi:anti-sigma regulatory factor (Ser/Thr protein kinase)
VLSTTVTSQRGQFKAGTLAGCDAADWIAAWAAACGFAAETTLAMRLCVEELVTNVVMHGLRGDLANHSIELIAEAEQDRARIVMIDDGKSFDITRAEDPGRQCSIDVATIGGRGIRLIRAYATHVDWQRIDGRNRTGLTFRISATQDT